MHKKWLAITLLGWLVIVACSSVITLPTLFLRLCWMALQQAWLIFGGLKTINRSLQIKWDITHVLGGIKGGILLFLLNTLISYVLILVLSFIFGSENVLMFLANERVGIEQLFAVQEVPVLMAVFVLLVVGAPISEELIFRGGVLYGLTQVTSPRVANIVSALIFALVHYYIIQFLPILFSGLFLGYLFLKERNLVQPIVAHATVNLIGFLLYI